MDQVLELQTKMLLEDLFYALSGFDTSRIYLEGDTAQVTTIDHPAALVEPFGFLIVKIREFYNVERFNIFVSNYLKKMSTLRKSTGTVEELLVSLQEDMEVFRDMDRLSKGEPIDINGVVHRHFHLENRTKLTESVNSWINLAKTSDIVDVRPIEGFSSCFWKDCFRLRNVDMCKEEMEGIEDCGKIVFFIRAIFGIEVVDDENYSGMHLNQKPPKRRLPLKSPHKKADTCPAQNVQGDGGDSPSGLLTGKDSFSTSDIYEEHTRDGGCVGADISDRADKAETHDAEEKLLSPFHFPGSISTRRRELHSILNALISDKIRDETCLIHSIVYMQDFNVFLGIFEELGQDLLASKPITKRINDCFYEHRSRETSILAFELCDVELGEYVLKLLKHHRVPQSNCYLSNLQRVSVVFEGGMLKYFVPSKSFVELKIIFRFLFSLSTTIYYLERSKSYNFTRVIYLVFMRIRSTPISLVEYSDSVDVFIADLTRQTSGLLNDFYLTNADVFVHLSRLIDVGQEYLQIEYKEHIDVGSFSNRTRESVSGLLMEILRHYGDSEFTEFLKGLDVGKCLK